MTRHDFSGEGDSQRIVQETEICLYRHMVYTLTRIFPGKRDGKHSQRFWNPGKKNRPSDS